MNTKKIITLTVLASFGGQLAIPFMAFAAPTGERSNAQQNFCSRLPALTERTQGAVAQPIEKMKEQKEKRLDRLADNREHRKDGLSGRRSEWDENRIARYDKLLERASTTVQKEAVTKFKITIEKLVEDRRVAVDKAHATFRTGVDAAIGARKSSVEMAIANFKTASDAALAKAKSDCEAGKDSRVVREAYRTSTEAARKKMQDDRRAIEKARITIDPLVEARRVAVDKALKVFKAGVEQARTELKAAFK